MSISKAAKYEIDVAKTDMSGIVADLTEIRDRLKSMAMPRTQSFITKLDRAIKYAKACSLTIETSTVEVPKSSPIEAEPNG